MPRAFLFKKSHSVSAGARPNSPKLFSPTSSGIASPSSSNASNASSSPSRHDENDHENRFEPMSSPHYPYDKDNNQGLDLSMKSLLKETNHQESNNTFVSSYPYPAKFAKIADFLRTSEVTKTSSNSFEPLNFSTMSKSPMLPEGMPAPYKSVNFVATTEAVSQSLAQSFHQRMSPYSINWSEHFSVNKIPIVSPAARSHSSDDSGRGSVHSDESDKSADGLKLKNGKKADRYQCPDCSKSYSTQSGLAKHQEFLCSTQVKKSFSCKHCEKVYVSLGALKMHIRTHTLPCKCKLCGKAFSRPWLLQGHIRTHTGEKPFACQYCNRAFADRSNLRAHLQTHSVVKKYSCKSCSRTFSRMSLLLKHEDNGCSGGRLSLTASSPIPMIQV